MGKTKLQAAPEPPPVLTISTAIEGHLLRVALFINGQPGAGELQLSPATVFRPTSATGEFVIALDGKYRVFRAEYLQEFAIVGRVMHDGQYVLSDPTIVKISEVSK
ncbi:MAG: hypothetical protein ABFD54_15045 [Armatimonadota bacterium]|nr:hypothetical protein [bacterium]